METQIAGSIARMDGSTSQDAIFKDVLAYKEVLAHIMKTCVPEYKDCTIPQIIGYIEPNPQVVDLGVVQGSGGKLDPLGHTTCEQALAMFYRAYINLTGESQADWIRFILSFPPFCYKPIVSRVKKFSKCEKLGYLIFWWNCAGTRGLPFVNFAWRRKTSPREACASRGAVIP